MSKKKKVEPPKPSAPPENYLGVFRTAGQTIPRGPTPCFWERPFVVIVAASNGVLSIPQFCSAYSVWGSSYIRAYATEAEAVAEAKKHSIAAGAHYAVLDLTCSGPQEIEVEK